MESAAVVDEIHALVDVVAGDPPEDRGDVLRVLHDARRLRSWLEARQAVLVRSLGACSAWPEDDLASVERAGLSAARKLCRRANAGGQIPALEQALAAGEITAGHVDVVSDVLHGEEPVVRRGLLGQASSLVDQARQQSVDEFRRSANREARRLRRDHGMARFEQQRRDTRLRSWTDGVTGMWHLHGSFDPESAVRIATRLDRTVSELFRDSTPETCPSDPVAKQDHLRALALLALVTADHGSGGTTASADVTVVIDLTKPEVEIDWGIPVELPPSVLSDVLEHARTDTCGVVLRNGVVFHAPGRLDLGRSSRLASRDQRRALRARHPTCAIDGCEVRFNHCKIHHVVWWRHGGRTDFANLVPLCAGHHAGVHRGDVRLDVVDRAEPSLSLQ